jgi:hypothetical protein
MIRLLTSSNYMVAVLADHRRMRLDGYIEYLSILDRLGWILIFRFTPL